MHCQWVSTEGYHTEHPKRHLCFLKYLDPAFYLKIGTSACMVDPEYIVDWLWAVHANAYPDAMLRNEFEPRFVEHCTVGLNSQIHACYFTKGFAGPKTPGIKLPDPNKARLTSVKRETHAILAAEMAVPGHSCEGSLKNLI